MIHDLRMLSGSYALPVRSASGRQAMLNKNIVVRSTTSSDLCLRGLRGALGMWMRTVVQRLCLESANAAMCFPGGTSAS
jgi:hypothetical protein